MLIDENSVYNTDIGVQEFAPLTDVKADDYFFITIMTQDNNEMELTDATGWTQVSLSSTGSNCEVEVWYKKVAVDSEVPTGVENTGTDNTWSNILLVRGLDTSNPIDVASGSYATSALAVCPDVTSTQANNIVLRAAVSDAQNFTRPTSIPTILFETDYYMGWSTVDATTTGVLNITMAASDQWAASTVVLKRAATDTSTPVKVQNAIGGTETLTQVTGQTHNGDDWRDIVRASGKVFDLPGSAETWSVDMSLTPTAATRVMKADNFSTVFPVGGGTSVVTFANGASGTLKRIEQQDSNSYFMFFEGWSGSTPPNNNSGSQSGTGYTCLSEGTTIYELTTDMVNTGITKPASGRGIYITGMNTGLGVADGYYITGTTSKGIGTGISPIGYWVTLQTDAASYKDSSAVTLSGTNTGTATITDSGMLIYDYNVTTPFAYPNETAGTIYWNANVVGNNKEFTAAKDLDADICVIFTKPYTGNNKQIWFWAADSSGNWKCWLVFQNGTVSIDHTTFIDFADIEGLVNSDGTFDATDIKHYGTFFKQKSSAQYRTPTGTYDLYTLNTMTVTGGSTTYPIALWMIEKNVNKGIRVNGTVFEEYMSTSAPSQFLLGGKLKLGDGVLTNTAVSAQNTSLSFNPHSDGIGTFFYYVGAYKAGIEVDRCSGDLTYDTIASDAGWYYISTDDDIDLSGAILVGSDAALDDGKTYENISFVNSKQVTLDAGSGLDGCTINGSIETGTVGGLLIDIADSPIVKNTVIKNSVGYGIRIDGVGDITLNGMTFSDNATKDIYVSASSGTVNITTDVAGITYDSAGATVNIIAPSTSFDFIVSPSITGYEWRLYEVDNTGSLTGAIEIDGEESATVDNQSITNDEIRTVALQIISQPDHDYTESITWYELIAADLSVTILLTKDINN